MRELKYEDPCELELDVDLELESGDVDAAVAAVAAASVGQIPCSCCNEVLNNSEQLHQHQVQQHTSAELSLALVTLRGLDHPSVNGAFDVNGRPEFDDSIHLRNILLESGDRPGGCDSESTITVNSEARMAMVTPPSSPGLYPSQETDPINVWSSWDLANQSFEQPSGEPSNDSGFWSGSSESKIKKPAKAQRKSNNKAKDVDRQFLCSVCDRGYKKKSHLERHLRIHTGVRPYECHICKKCFAVRSILKQHIRVHTGERPFSCNVCYQRFPQKSGLMTHMMLHNGKPFKCEHCVKSFVSNHKLMLHQRSHRDLLFGSSQLGPHCCSSCDLRFFTAGALSDHMKLHTRRETNETTAADSTNEIITISEDAAKIAVSAVEDFQADMFQEDLLEIVKHEGIFNDDYDGSEDASSFCETKWNDIENMCFEPQFKFC